MARARRSTALKVKSYAQDSGSEGEEEEDEMQVESSEFEETASTGSKRSIRMQEDTYVEDAEEEFIPEAKQTSKSKGKGKAVARGRAGKLQSMVNLPIDVWFSIAEDLDPLSLLNLGRANKMMRSLFASKTRSKGLWNIVKRSVHLPELESNDLNDLQLTSLVWERNCHVCAKPRAVLVDYCLRKRWCKLCRSKNLVLATRLRTQIKSCVPSLPDLSLYTHQGPTNHNWNRKRYHYKAEAIGVNDKVIELQGEVEEAKGKKSRAAAQEELDAYLVERKALVKTAFQDGTKLALWERSSAADRKDQDAAARQARTAAIKAKLVELGYDDRDIASMWRVQHLLDQPTPLTPTIWNRISAKIIEDVESSKRNRLDREADDRVVSRREKIEPFFEALRDDANDKLFPSFTLFLSIPVVQLFWKEEDSSIDEDIWHNSLDEIQSQLPKVKRWIQLEFARNLIKAYDEISHPVSEELRKSIHFPEPILRDYSGSRFNYTTSLDIDDPSTISPDDLDTHLSRFTAKFKSTALRQTPIDWLSYYSSNRESVVHGLRNAVPDKWLQTQVRILKETGLQDSKETSQELEELGANFDCQGCHDHLKYSPSYSWLNTVPIVKPSKTTGMTWSEMSRHAFEHHSDGFNTSYYTVPTIRYAEFASHGVIAVNRLVEKSENQVEEQEEEEVHAFLTDEQAQVKALIKTHKAKRGELDVDALIVADENDNRIEDAFEEDKEVEHLLETHGVGSTAGKA